MRSYKDFEVWQKGHLFTLKIYKVTKAFPKDEIYGLRSQIRRAAASIPANIVEGSARVGDKQFARFLEIAFASANEAKYLLSLSHELNYIDDTDLFKLEQMINEIIKMLRSFINRLRH